MAKLARQVLADKGLELKREPYRGKVEPKHVVIDPRKTARMLQLEAYFGQPIEVLLSSDDPGREIAVRLSVNQATVCKWRKKLEVVTPHANLASIWRKSDNQQNSNETVLAEQVVDGYTT